MDEILNIEHHKQRLIIKALNKLKSYQRAAVALGISERQLYRWKRDYDIYKNDKGEYLMIKKIEL